MDPIKLDTLTYPEIQSLLENGCDTIIFPVGTLEAHGRHAPVGTDNICAEEISWRLSESLSFPVAPTLNYGITTSLVSYPGSQRIHKELYADLMENILEDFFLMGFRRVIIINGHGGNTETLKNVAKEIIYDDRGNRHIIVVDWWQLDEDALAIVYGRPGGHAALDETACVVAYRPETLKPENLSEEDGWHFTPGVISLPCPDPMLFYDKGDALPDFDPDKASKFMALVLKKIEAVLREEIRLFERSFGD